MKGKIAMIFFAAVILILACSSPTRAAPSLPGLQVYGYTNSPQYKPGDSGSIKVWIYNTGSVTATLKNVTIVYPWVSPSTNLELGGNDTIMISSVNLGTNENYSVTDQFTVPTDGRLMPQYSGSSLAASVTVGYEYYTGTPAIKVSTFSYPTSVHMNIPLPYLSMLTPDLDMVQTLLIVNIVIMLVGAIIIAVAILMRKHSPPAPPP